MNEIKEVPEKEILNGQITFENLSFRYPTRPDEAVLSDYNMTISENQLELDANSL